MGALPAPSPLPCPPHPLPAAQPGTQRQSHAGPQAAVLVLVLVLILVLSTCQGGEQQLRSPPMPCTPLADSSRPHADAAGLPPSTAFGAEAGWPPSLPGADKQSFGATLITGALTSCLLARAEEGRMLGRWVYPDQPHSHPGAREGGTGTWHKGTPGMCQWGQLVTNATRLSLQSGGRCSPGHRTSTSGVTARQRWPFKGFVPIPVHIFPIFHPLPRRYRLGGGGGRLGHPELLTTGSLQKGTGDSGKPRQERQSRSARSCARIPGSDTAIKHPPCSVLSPGSSCSRLQLLELFPEGALLLSVPGQGPGLGLRRPYRSRAGDTAVPQRVLLPGRRLLPMPAPSPLRRQMLGASSPLPEGRGSRWSQK